MWTANSSRTVTLLTHSRLTNQPYPTMSGILNTSTAATNGFNVGQKLSRFIVFVVILLDQTCSVRVDGVARLLSPFKRWMICRKERFLFIGMIVRLVTTSQHVFDPRVKLVLISTAIGLHFDGSMPGCAYFSRHV